MTSAARQGPLAHVRVLELPALGPVPFAGMLMADLGADVVRVDRCEFVDQTPGSALDAVLTGHDTLARSRRRVALDLKAREGIDAVRRLARRADVVLEGFRPGVADRLGIGPHDLMTLNPGLIYARVTGWGQEGPLARTAGHELTYLAVAGALSGLPDGTLPPLGSLGDIPAGMLAVVGALAAVAERQVSGQGQVVDASILDTALLTGAIDRFLRTGDEWDAPGENALDGGSHYYRSYRTSDDRWIALAALEPKFHDAMLTALGIDPAEVEQEDSIRWPEYAQRIQDVVGSRPLSHWTARFATVDTCFAPLLTWKEAASHPQAAARLGAPDIAGQRQPLPAPVFHRTPAVPPGAPSGAGADTISVLDEAGYSTAEVQALLRIGAARQAAPSPGGAHA